MSGNFYGGLSIPHDELSRQRQLAQLQRASGALQEQVAKHRHFAEGRGGENTFEHEEALSRVTFTQAVRS